MTANRSKLIVPSAPLIAELRSRGEVHIGNGTMAARNLLKKGVYETVISEGGVETAYVVIIDDSMGEHVIYRPTYYRRSFSGRTARSNMWALEVNPQYRGMKHGRSVLTLGIGAAYGDFLDGLDGGTVPDFSVNAEGIRGREEFFRKCGFDIEHFSYGSSIRQVNGKYTKATAPDIVLLYQTSIG